MLEAILATDLELATPTEIVRPNFDKTFCYNFFAICGGVIVPAIKWLTSKYASSNESGSTKGVISLNTSITCLDTSRYTANLGETTTASEHFLKAMLVGMADLIPNFLDS